MRKFAPLFASLLLACATGPRLTPAGYANPKLGFEISYAEGQSTFINTDWVIRSHDSTGAPIHTTTSDAEFDLDHDNNGDADKTVKYPRHDLALRNKRDGARITIRRVILTAGDIADLRPWLREAGRAVSGEVWFADGARNWTSRLESESPLRLAGLSAAQATFDIADVDRLHLSPKSIDRKIRVVATDAFEETFQVAHGVKTSAYPYTPASKTVTYPVRLVAIYDAAPEEFDAHAEEFTALLRGISIRGQSGVELDFAPVRPAQEAAAPPIVAPPAPPPVAPVATEPAPPPPPAATAAATSGKPLVPPAPAKSAGKKTPAPTSGTDK